MWLAKGRRAVGNSASGTPHRDASEARVRYDWFPIHLASYVSYQSSDYSTDGTTVILTAVQMAHSVFRIEPCT